jgi:hypothetical protein
MINIDTYEILFLIAAFLFQLLLIIHFAMRRWKFDLAMRFGRLVYALSIPAAIASIIIISSGKPWYLWLGGLLYLIWAIYGYTIEYILGIEWRNAVRWSILVPYITLYLATVMFYWWPVALIYKPLWYVFAFLFLASTYLNVTSHKRPARVLQ